MTSLTYVFIFARGGSKGIPQKNLQLIGPNSLCSISILLAQKIPAFDKIFLSTDCPYIEHVALSLGIEVILRPEYLASDTSPEWLSWQHAVNHVYTKYGQFDTFVSLPPTSPCRSEVDIVNCLDAFDGSSDVVVTMTKSSRSPFFNMVHSNSEGFLNPVISSSSIFRRQDVPISFDLTTVCYITSPDFVINNSSLWDGSVKGVLVPKERAIDIDDPFDLDYARFIYSRDGAPF